MTGVRVVTGNESEADSLLPLVKDLKARGLVADKLAADKGYDGKDLREELRQLGIRAHTPQRQTKSNLPEGFTYDQKRDAIRCPKGKFSQKKTPHQHGGTLYSFRSVDCQRCPLRDGCRSANRKAKIVYYRANLHEHRSKGIHQAMRIRRTVERVFGDAKHWHRTEHVHSETTTGRNFIPGGAPPRGHSELTAMFRQAAACLPLSRNVLPSRATDPADACWQSPSALRGR